MTTYQLQHLDLLTLFEMRARYSTLPSCQREFVWELREKQGFIDSILRGLPVPPIAYVETFVPLMGTKKELVDGQQRFETMCSFYRDEFKTASRFSSEEVLPLYPNRRYSELPVDVREKLDNYKLPMMFISDVDDNDIGLIFRRWQGGKKLTYAEKLYSYDGVTKDIAKRVAEHRLWTQLYSGFIKRRQPFQAGVKLILLETYGTFANLTSPRQVDMLQKKPDAWAEIPDRIERRLDAVVRLFDGAEITSVGQVVLAYQGVMLLDESGYMLTSIAPGVMRNWFMRVRKDALEEQRNRMGDFFSKFDKVMVQREFWASEWQEFTELAISGKRHSKRYANTWDKLRLWDSQQGKCGICGKDMRYQDGVVAHHITPHANGGETDVDNLVLVHDACHKEKHNQVTQFGLTPLQADRVSSVQSGEEGSNHAAA